jgi:hypothetical protein
VPESFELIAPTDEFESVEFESVDAVAEAVRAQGYIADTRLATTVFLLTRLDKPLLVEGPAGVGKTELAKMLAAATGRRLLRLQCYEGQDETKVLALMAVGTVLFWTLIVLGVIAVVRYLLSGGDRRPEERPTPEDLLAERFARGEIDEQDYHRRLDVLHGSPDRMIEP